MLKSAYNQGVHAALVRFKLAGPLGADMPPGSVGAHGTQFSLPYSPRTNANPEAGEPYDPAAQINTEDRIDKLWNISDIDHMAPGGAGGQYGEEVIG